eukprot:sb/3468090/
MKSYKSSKRSAGKPFNSRPSEYLTQQEENEGESEALTGAYRKDQSSIPIREDTSPARRDISPVIRAQSPVKQIRDSWPPSNQDNSADKKDMSPQQRKELSPVRPVLRDRSPLKTQTRQISPPRHRPSLGNKELSSPGNKELSSPGNKELSSPPRYLKDQGEPNLSSPSRYKGGDTELSPRYGDSEKDDIVSQDQELRASSSTSLKENDNSQLPLSITEYQKLFTEKQKQKQGQEKHPVVRRFGTARSQFHTSTTTPSSITPRGLVKCTTSNRG